MAGVTSGRVDGLTGSDPDDMAAIAKLEQLLVNHLRFANAFKQNDTARIVPFLDKDVTMRTMDGAVLEGQPAVLAHLVGARMAKLSANLHVKGCPSRTGAWQSSFVYEHGLLFKDPLYIEVLDWKAPATIVGISHVPLPDAKRNKSFQEFLKAAPFCSTLRKSFNGDSSSRRSMLEWSDGDSSSGREDSGSEDTALPLSSRRSICAGDLRTRQRVSSCDSTGSSSAEVSAPPSPFEDDAPVFDLTALRVETTLTPIRKRKAVNPFVVLRCTSTGAVWKSPIRRRQRSPVWTAIPIAIPVRSTSDVLEVALWDQAFLRSTKVATATIVVADLLREGAQDRVVVDMERYEFADKATSVQPTEPSTIRVQLDFKRRVGGGRSRTAIYGLQRSSIGDNGEVVIGKNETVGEEEQAMTVASSAAKWVGMDPLFVRTAVLAAFVAVLVWLVFHVKLPGRLA